MMWGLARPCFYNDPGCGGAAGDWESYYKVYTSEPDDPGASSGSYSSEKLMTGYTSQTVEDVGPCTGAYDPEWGAIFGEEF